MSLIYFRLFHPISLLFLGEKFINARNKLIPVAENHADKTAGAKPPKGTTHDDWADKWNQAYHGKMTELAGKMGL
jgi:hypothetical protein